MVKLLSAAPLVASVAVFGAAAASTKIIRCSYRWHGAAMAAFGAPRTE